MANRQIVWCGHPTLRKRARPVKEISDEVRALVADLVDTVEAAPGLGLAAPQIDESLRVVVAREDVGEEFPIYCLINPRVVRRGGRSEALRAA